MPDKNPETWSAVTWLLLIMMSMLGGVSSWYRRVKDGHTRAFNIIELIGEMSVSAPMGFVGFAVANHYFDSISIGAAAAGMSAHFSTRLLFSAEGLIEIAVKGIESKLRGGK